MWSWEFPYGDSNPGLLRVFDIPEVLKIENQIY